MSMSALATADTDLQHPPAALGCGTVTPQAQLVYRMARSRKDRHGAFQLVYNSYVRSGLGVPNRHEMRVTPFQLNSGSQIFVAVLGEKVVSTVTLVSDSEMGLPMEFMFAAEIGTLRAQGRRIAEVSCLADRRQEPRRFLDTFSELTRLMAQFARYEGIQNLLVSVHPRHARFYTRYLGFQPISDRVANCPHVQDHPAVALHLDFEHIDRERPECWDEFFGVWLTRKELLPYVIGREEREELAEVARVCGHDPTLQVNWQECRDPIQVQPLCESSAS